MKKILCAVMTLMLLMTVMPVTAEETADAAETAAEQAAAAEVASEAPAVQTVEATLNSQKLDASYLRVLNAIKENDLETAKDFINICFAYCDRQDNPTMYADLLLKRACIDVLQEKNDMALLYLDAALAVDPKLGDAYLVRTEIYRSTGEVDKAIENAEKNIELTQDTSLYKIIAELQEAKGDMAAAQEAWQKYIDGAGEGVEEEAEFQNGSYRMAAGDLEGAVASFEKYLENETYAAAAYFNTGLCKVDLQDYAGATEAFNKSEELGLVYDGLYYYRGISKLLNGDFAEAEADFNASIEKEENYRNGSRYNLALTKYYAEDYEAAIAAFTEYINIAGADGSVPDFSAYFYRAMAEGITGQLKEAEADYTVCIENGFAASDSYYNRAKIYEALGDTEKQNADLEAALKYGE